MIYLLKRTAKLCQESLNLILIEVGASIGLVAEPVLVDLLLDEPIALEAIGEGHKVSGLDGGGVVSVDDVHLARDYVAKLVGVINLRRGLDTDLVLLAALGGPSGPRCDIHLLDLRISGSLYVEIVRDRLSSLPAGGLIDTFLADHAHQLVGIVLGPIDAPLVFSRLVRLSIPSSLATARPTKHTTLLKMRKLIRSEWLQPPSWSWCPSSHSRKKLFKVLERILLSSILG